MESLSPLDIRWLDNSEHTFYHSPIQVGLNRRKDQKKWVELVNQPKDLTDESFLLSSSF
jgi:hypothetical protein